MKKIRFQARGTKGLFILNILSFLLVFSVLQTIIMVAINFSIYYNVDKGIIEYCENIESNIVVDEDRILLSKKGSYDSSINVVCYKKDSDAPIILSTGIVSMLVPDLKSIDQFETANEYQTYIKDEIVVLAQNHVLQKNVKAQKAVSQEFTKDELGNEFHFRTLTIGLSYDSELYQNDIEYVKVLIMVNGEVATRNLLFSITLIGIGALLLISMITSYILAKTEIIPIKEALDKQLTFVNDASHELRTPLAIVQSKLENLLAEPNKTIIEASSDVAVSLKEVQRLKKLTDDLLHLARSDNKKVVLNLENANLKDILSEVCFEFKEICEFNSKQLKYELEDSYIECDKNQIHELMIILLDNALRYTQENDSITVKLYNLDKSVYIEVIDTGIGISDGGLKKVFERFYREDKARSRQTGGNGLGLSIALEIVTSHGGKIYANHNEPKGTKFTVKF